MKIPRPSCSLGASGAAFPDSRISCTVEAGFIPKVTVDLGAEEMVDAIVTGLIDDPESIFYRNAKWMKELTQFGDTKHKEFVSLMESMARSMAPAVR